MSDSQPTESTAVKWALSGLIFLIAVIVIVAVVLAAIGIIHVG